MTSFYLQQNYQRNMKMENVELRWLDTGQTTVLQYRTKRLQEKYSAQVGTDCPETYFQSEWSEWYTVPTTFQGNNK